MDAHEFRKWGKQMVDYVADYWTTLPSRRPQADVKPGYIRQLLPEDPPENGESFENIFADLESVIMKGITHWHHPRFFAYLPAGNSYPSIVGDILSSGIGSLGFTWASSPVYTELEMAMMDWLAKLVGLPEQFLFSSDGPGAGVIQGSASECVYLSMLAAKKQAINSLSDKENESMLVAYASDQAHTSVEKATLMNAVQFHPVKCDQLCRMTSSALQQAIEEDKEKGLIPFFVCVTLGTTVCCAFDRLPEIGPICASNNLWLHVDAAYAGCATICPEYRWIFQGIEYADTINFNPHKALMINFDCSAFWMKDVKKLERTFYVNAQYLKYDQEGLIPDLRNWQVPLGRRFRSLKLWFTFRAFGAENLRKNFRKMCSLAEYFASLVQKDQNFEIVQPVNLGVVCFRIKGSNEINEEAARIINNKGDIYFSTATIHEMCTLRLSITSAMTEKSDVMFAWQQIKETAKLLSEGGRHTAES
uniref:Aromatic-L-amino-acid decarboxylase n=1 Tax=Trichuris muris TaxID=70415 RepID=A0A5S6PZI8_TRIMR